MECCYICPIPDCLLPHRVNIEACEIVKQGMGAAQRKYPPYGGSVKYADEKCLVSPLAADKIMEFLHNGMKTSHEVYFGRNLGLELTERIVFGSRYFEVRGFQDVAEQGVVYIVHAQEVTY